MNAFMPRTTPPISNTRLRLTSPNSLVVEEFLRWMQQAGRLQDDALDATQD